MALITNSNNLSHFIKILNYELILILIQLLHFIMTKFSELIFLLKYLIQILISL